MTIQIQVLREDEYTWVLHYTKHQMGPSVNERSGSVTLESSDFLWRILMSQVYNSP